MKPHRTAVRFATFVGFAALFLARWSSLHDFHEPMTLRSPTEKSGSSSPSSPPILLAGSAESLARDGDLIAQEGTRLARFLARRLREWCDDDDPEKREARTAELERTLASAGGIADQLELLTALPTDLMDFAFGLPTFQRWMFANPAPALGWMSQHPEIFGPRVLTLLQDWDEKDHPEFLRYLAALPAGDWKQTVMTAASYQALPDDPVEAIVRARQLNVGGPQLGLLELATREWARHDAEAAGRWVSEVLDAGVKEKLIGALAIGAADLAPEFAATWAVAALPPGKTLEATVAEIAAVWARQNPAAVAAWLERFPAGEARQTAIGNLLNGWMNRDQAAALAWVREQPDKTLRAEATVFIADPDFNEGR
jgi:hypothetical protein